MCSVFAIANNPEAANMVALGLHALQHRGQEGAGIITTDGTEHFVVRKSGMVRDVFSPDSIVSLKGTAAIGHTRYSTTGASVDANLQPFLMRTRLGWLAIAHNGNLVNAKDLISALEKQGSIFQSTSDTEVILHLLSRGYGDKLVEVLPEVLKLLEGAYSLLILNHKQLIAIRDPMGFRPLVMGALGESILFASETTAFDLIGAHYVREVQPGEMIVVDLGTGSYKSYYPLHSQRHCRCIFEHIYFAKPDSNLFGANVYEVRRQLGRRLAIEHKAPGQIVIPVPDSGVPAAIGYAEQSRIPFGMGLVRSHYVQRTFLQPKQHIRDLSVKLKFSALSTIKGMSLVVVDDSLVRGTTSKKIISMLRDAGAKEIHLRISAPPTTNPCVYGIDTPTKEELIASKKEVDAIAEMVGADTLGYLSLDGLLETVRKVAGPGWCHACFSGEYPT